jgi:toxin YoeB
MYKLEFTEGAKKHVQKLYSTKYYKKFEALVEELELHPKTGTGKPEQLKHYEIPTW